MKNNVIIYLSELGILTEIDGKVKKKYGENFDNGGCLKMVKILSSASIFLFKLKAL